MNTNQQAASEFLEFANRLRGMVAFAEHVKDIGNLEQHEAELRMLIDQNERKLAEVQAQLQEAKDNVAEETRAAADLREQTNVHVTKTVNDAHVAAGLKLDDAQKQAAAVMDRAEASRKATESKIAERETYLNEVRKEIMVYEHKRDSLREEMAAIAKKHLG